MLRHLLVAVAVAAATLGGSAGAQNADEIAKACAGDIERFCRGVPPGEGRIKECMRAHITELSAPCFDVILSAVASGHEPRQ
jgi:hypothetical protein